MKRSFTSLLSILLILATCFASFMSCTTTVDQTVIDPGTSSEESEESSDPGSSEESEEQGETEEEIRALNFTIVINEVCSRNNTYADPIDSQAYDWIELYNTGDTDFSLSGYGISDRSGKIKHIFDATCVVPAKGFLMLYACGKDAMEGKSQTGVYLPFSISKNGETVYLYSKRGTSLDSMEVPALEKDTSYGYIQDGTGTCARLSCTPGATNSTANVLTLGDTVATFSHETGFYDEAITLKITVPEGYTVRYTTDCTEPNASSAVFPQEGLVLTDASLNANQYANQYTGVMEIVMYESYSKVYGYAKDNVDKCNVIRCVVYDGEGRCTNVITKNYFVGDSFSEGYDDLAIVSMVSDPSTLYGSTGLMTNSTKWYNKTEQEVSFTYISSKHNYKFDQQIGIRLHGTSTPKYNQKSFTLFARGKYGNSAFEEAVVGTASTLHSMVLRTDGTTKLQEGFLTSFVSNTECQTCEYKPVAVFLDGEYYGVFNLYERFCEDYCEENYGVDADNIYIVKKGSEGNVTGALAAWQTTYKWLCSTDFTKEANWKKLQETIDVQSLIDLIAAETYLCNADWSIGRSSNNSSGQNYACWRVIDTSSEDPTNPYADGKWRFVLYDMDISAGAYKAAINRAGASSAVKNFDCTSSYNGFTGAMIWAGVALEGMPMWVNLKKVAAFKEQFSIAFQDLCNLNFYGAGDKIKAEVQRYAPWMAKQIDRFGIPVTAWKSGSNQNGTSDADWKPDVFYGGHTTRPDHATSEDYVYEMSRMIEFMENHSPYALEDLEESMSLQGDLVAVAISCPYEKGSVYMNNNRTLVPIPEDDDYFEATYYTDYDLTFEAEAKEGYTFTGWKITGNATISSTTDAKVTVSFTGAFTIIPQFVKNS